MEVMVSTLPNQFSGEYPGTDEARAALSKTLSPLNKIERKNGPSKCADLLKQLETLMPLNCSLSSPVEPSLWNMNRSLGLSSKT